MNQPERPAALRYANTEHFDDRTALHLTQAFNQESDLEPLLALMFSQLQALGGVEGLQYTHEEDGIDYLLGRKALHNAHYNLHTDTDNLGGINLFFSRRQHDAGLQTCEDILSLAFTAIRNALKVRALTDSNTTSAPTTKAADPQASLTKEEKADALILVALDGHDQTRDNEGDEWAHILMTSAHTQIKAGLRQADGVYQIGEDLIAVLLPHTTLDQACEVAEKIRILIASLHLQGAQVNQQLTASMGVSDATLATTAEEVMDHARHALRAAQTAGKNQIRLFDEALAGELGVG